MRSWNLYPLGEFVLKAKIGFQKVLGELFHRGSAPGEYLIPPSFSVERDGARTPSQRDAHPAGFRVPRAGFHDGGCLP